MINHKYIKTYTYGQYLSTVPACGDDGDGVDNDGGDDDRRQKTCPPEGRTAARIGREEPFKAFTMKSCASCEKL